MNKTKLRERILARIQGPQIPSREVIFTGDGADIQGAIDQLAAQGGGRLILPKGTYRTGAIHMKNGVELHLAEEETVLQFIPEEPEKNYPVVFSHWEGTPCYNYSALLYACDAHDIAVTGKGVLDGGADDNHWWNWHHQMEKSWCSDGVDLQMADRMALRDMNMKGVPVSERVFGPGHYLRPKFVQFMRCSNVLIQGVTLKNSPMWQLNPVLCRSVIVDGVTLFSHGYNNDGCDPESCDGVWIKNCYFDTGDDCISLKSGRDRDGREANIPCQNILIENNDFADGHGGVALGSEMSGGIHTVLACNNRFSSPNLTYALRLKTNAKRGGAVEDIMLCDSVMDCVHGAAVHGTMLYEDGRNGDTLPVFRNITVENIQAHGGDYGVFLEAFPEVPITGLVLRNITIDDAEKELRSMNWQDAVVENVTINGKKFPRPGFVRILGVPSPGCEVKASAESCGGLRELVFTWKYEDGTVLSGESIIVEAGHGRLRVQAQDEDGNAEGSRWYQVVEDAATPWARLECRDMWQGGDLSQPVTRLLLARMLEPLTSGKTNKKPVDTACEAACKAASSNFFPLEDGKFYPEKPVTRQEMATVAMQACGVNYRNASSTMPVCKDVADVANNYGTNVARALYFGFMKLEDGYFYPKRSVTLAEAVEIISNTADFAGI